MTREKQYEHISYTSHTNTFMWMNQP